MSDMGFESGTEEGANRGRGGMVLVLVVVLLGLITAMIVQSQMLARLAVRTEEARLRKARLNVAVSDAARILLQRLADDPRLDIDHVEEDWAQPYEAEHPSGVAVWARVTDANRFFDINNLYLEQSDPLPRPPADVMMDLMTVCGDFTPIARVQALGDWIDPDEEGFRESGYYLQRDPPCESPNRWLASMAEVLFADGFSKEYFAPVERYSRQDVLQADLAECVRTIPVRRSAPIPVNINTASREVLLGVVGMAQEDWVRYVLVLRNDRPLVSLDPLFAAGNQALLELVRPFLAVHSVCFEIEVRAFEQGQAEELWVLARRDRGGEVDVLQWVYR